MAKKSKITQQLRRQQIVEKYRKLRHELKRKAVNPNLSLEERQQAQLRLQKLPRDASPVRLRNRCSVDGRPRGYLRKFGVSRVKLRKLANEGMLPGVVKSSW